MTIRPSDLEEIIDDVLRVGGGDDDDPPSFHAIVKAQGVRVLTTRGLLTEAALARIHGEWRVYKRPRLRLERERFLVFHEIGEKRLRELGYSGPDREEAANYIAAGLVCPRRIFRRAVRAGLSLAELAHDFVASQTLVTLRRAELLAEPRAVVCRHRVYVRWDGATLTDSEWRAAVEYSRPGLRKVRLTDQRGRIAVEPALVG